MFAIAGAILINAACILMVHESGSNNLYPFRLLLLTFGAGLIGGNLALSFRQFRKSSTAQSTP